MLDTLKRVTPEILDDIKNEMAIRKTREVFLLFALGSQFDHLIKQALDRLGVFCLVADPAKVSAMDVRALGPTGIVLSGGPASVHAEPPPFDPAIFDLGIQTLGICLGFQMWAAHAGAKVVASDKREFGTHDLAVHNSNRLFAGMPAQTRVLESHGDRIEPHAFLEVLASTRHAQLAAARAGHLWGVQFHPEVTETEHGDRMLENFVFGICGAQDRFPAKDVAARKVAELADKIAGKRVLLALSGGSDSSVVATLLRRAVNDEPDRLRAIYIKGIDRPDDEAHVHEFFGDQFWIELKVVDATARFLEVLAGKSTMKEKRIAMRSVYKSVLEEEAQIYGADFIAQGTLYTDISESGTGYDSGARRAQIKLHHNTNLGFGLPELTPLMDCVKDGARLIGRELGTPEELLIRHPFPGPGLVVRIEGEVTAENLAEARAIDAIYIEELRKHDLYHTVWQSGAVVTRSRHTCTKGDDAADGAVVTLWAVWSVNGFTARWAELPSDFLRHVSQRITNEVRGVGAVTYRISDKPPTTIEWG